MTDSVRINYCWPSPAEPFFVLGSAGLVSIFLALFKYRATQSELGSQLLYDWRFTAHQFVLAPSPFETHDQNFLSAQHLRL
jgi:hypothetical protein